MEITARQIPLQAEQTEIYIDLEIIEDIYIKFSEINRLKAELNDLSTLKILYAEVVNGLCEVTIENSWFGEWLSKIAIELGSQLRSSQAAYKRIKALEAELAEKYGFLHDYRNPAPNMK